MSRSRLRSFALITATLAISVAGLSAPAQAATTGTISGHLTNGGVGVADAQVWVDGGPTYQNATTDASGFYQLNDLDPGDYRVQFRPQGRAGQWAHQKTYRDEADSFHVAAGANTTVDDALLPVGTIKGHVKKPDGSPAINVQVSFENWSIDTNNWVATDADGNYTAGVLPGTYKIQFGGWSLRQYAPGKVDPNYATEFELAVGQTLSIDETMLPVGSFGGRITNPDGSAAADREVNLSNITGWEYHSVRTDAQGDYLFAEVHPDDYRVAVRLSNGFEQWAHGKFSSETAEVFKVNANAQTTVNEQLVQLGSVSGRFTNGDGSGFAGVEVMLESEIGDSWGYATTDSEGRWSALAPPGKYRVGFSQWETNFQQFAYGKVRPEDADVITVTSGQTTVVNDKRLPTGSVRVTAKDSVTGKAVSKFYAWLGMHSGETTNGVAVINDVPTGTYKLSINAPGYEGTDDAATVTVKEGQQTTVAITLVPKTNIQVTVVDSVTGKPLPGVCVQAFRSKSVRIGDAFCNSAELTDANGRLIIDYVRAGTYQLFAFPKEAPGYGAQWVGAARGYGDQRLAKTFALKNGQVITGVTVKMDKAGIVKGKVTMAPGTQHARVWTLPGAPYDSSDVGSVEIDEQGNYTMDFLGPYNWPLQFTAQDYPKQWSGGVSRRFAAKTVTVRTGQTTIYNYTLLKGAPVKVTVKGVSGGGVVIAYDALTGDMLWEGWTSDFAAEKVKLLILGTQLVRFAVDGESGYKVDGKIHIIKSGGTAITLNFS